MLAVLDHLEIRPAFARVKGHLNVVALYGLSWRVFVVEVAEVVELRAGDLPPVDVPIRSGSPGSRLLDGYVG